MKVVRSGLAALPMPAALLVAPGIRADPAPHAEPSAASSTAGDIRIVPVGPDLPKPAPATKVSGAASHQESKVVVSTSGKLVPPTGVVHANACKGDVVDSQCRFSVRKSVGEGRVGDARKLRLITRFSGNRALAPSTTTRSVKVRG